MIHEYLFLTDDNRTKVETYKPDGITVEISNIENTPLWVVTYESPNKNDDSAKKLSDVHAYIMQYSPLVLSCESSEYYNKTLFPLANELERKLRKLLYLAASISDNKKAKENIKQLEEKDFGEIFDLLFIDQNFILDVKKRINADSKSEFNGKSKYSKAEVQSYLETLVEHTLWDTILSDKDVPTLRSRFRDVQTYRNDVMHAHNISKELFGKARYLFDKINRELDVAIGKRIGNAEDEPTETKPDVNTAISSALVAMDLSAISEALRNATASAAILSQFPQALKDMQLQTTSAALSDALKGIQMPTMQPALAEAIRNATVFQASPAMESIRKQMRQISDLMKPYRQMGEILQPYKALQDSLRSIADNLPRATELIGAVDEEDESETDNGKQEEDDPNE